MRLSKYNIFSRIKNSDNYYLINILAGNADILNANLADEYINISKGGETKDAVFYNDLIEKKYLISEVEEQRIYKSKYLYFIDNREDDEVQLFFVPNYTCNFQCSYCYQDEYENSTKITRLEVIDAFFNYVDSEFINRKKYITIFGGEPLLDSPVQKDIVSYLLINAKKRNIDICIVTNGYNLVSYLEVFKNGNLREIQVTLDGKAEIHDKRRFLKGGKATFK